MYAVEISSFSVGSIAKSAGGTPTMYHIETRDRTGRQFKVSHRYSDFVALHNELARGVEFPVPKRTLAQKVQQSSSSLHERMRGLEHYLKCAVAAVDCGRRSVEAVAWAPTQSPTCAPGFLPPALLRFLAIPEISPSERIDPGCDKSSYK